MYGSIERNVETMTEKVDSNLRTRSPLLLHDISNSHDFKDPYISANKNKHNLMGQHLVHKPIYSHQFQEQITNIEERRKRKIEVGEKKTPFRKL